MNELSLFTGAGGGVLGTKLLGWRTVGYVEWDKYCQQIIEQRIEDDFLDEAPIFGDIDHFIESGASKKYSGFVDVVTAGFPCQPFSVAGKKKGQDDERNKWPQTIQCIRDVRPRYALLENVPGLLNSGYFGEILTSLAQAGFDARWCVLGADDVGAPHRRKRLWILADSESERHGRRDREERGDEGRNLQQSEQTGSAVGRETEGRCGSRREDVADSDEKRPQGVRPDDGQKRWEIEGGSPGLRDGAELGRKPDWWATEPNVGRVAHGVASRVDRLKAIGNGQVPQCVATAWRLLSD